MSVPLRLPKSLLPGCSGRTEWSPCGKEAERPDRGRTGLWPFPLSEGLSPESPSVWTGWTLGVGREYRRGAKVPANHSLTTGKVLASRKPKKLQFRRQRPQRSRIGAASAARPPAKFLSPHRHLDGNAVRMRRDFDFFGNTTETANCNCFSAAFHPFPTGTGRGCVPRHRQKAERGGTAKFRAWAEKGIPKRLDAEGLTRQQ